MRTRQLTVSVGAYENGDWHVALTESLYERGALVSSSVTANRYTTEDQVLLTTTRALQHAMDMERARVDLQKARRAHPSSARSGRSGASG